MNETSANKPRKMAAQIVRRLEDVVLDAGLAKDGSISWCFLSLKLSDVTLTLSVNDPTLLEWIMAQAATEGER